MVSHWLLLPLLGNFPVAFAWRFYFFKSVGVAVPHFMLLWMMNHVRPSIIGLSLRQKATN